MISALADAGAALDRPRLRRRRGRAARSSSGARCATATGGCCGRTTAARRASTAYLEDHAFLLEALLTLYGATFDPRWFGAARELADTIIARFSDAERGGFFATADDHETLIARRKDLEDNADPVRRLGRRVRAAAARAR